MKNFLCERRIQGGQTIVAPDWNACLEYEFQLRKQAFKLIREAYRPIGAALQLAYLDPQHRMTHWVSLLSLANTRGRDELERSCLTKEKACKFRARAKPSDKVAKSLLQS